MTYLVPFGNVALWTSMVVFRALYVHAATCMFAGSGERIVLVDVMSFINTLLTCPVGCRDPT